MSWPFLALLTLGTLAFTTWSASAQGQREPAIGGAGIGLRPTEDGRIIIDRVAPDGPAAKAGLQPGDWLVGVDRWAVADLTGAQLVEAIRGPVGSKVVLVYVRNPGAPVSATVIRAALGAAPAEPSAQPTPRELQPEPPLQKPGAVAAPVAGTMRFTQETIKDPAANNVSAVTFLLPQGWRFQGR